jgi:hypothetical protein
MQLPEWWLFPRPIISIRPTSKLRSTIACKEVSLDNWQACLASDQSAQGTHQESQRLVRLVFDGGVDRLLNAPAQLMLVEVFLHAARGCIDQMSCDRFLEEQDVQQPQLLRPLYECDDVDPTLSLFTICNQEASCCTCTAMMPLLTDLRRRSAAPGQADRLRASRLLKDTAETL